MNSRIRRILALLLLATAACWSLYASWSLYAPSGSNAMDQSDARKTVVYRDDFGIPHIYAPSVENGMYAMGYVQAEDRLEELLKNYLRAMGEMSAAFGDSHFRDDLMARVWDHYGVARRNYERIRPEIRRHTQFFARGVNDYMSQHPKEVPAWWGERRVDVYMSVAHGRQFMWGWPLGQALSDLRAGGLTPDFNVDFRSSNEWAVAPSRSSLKAPILLIDPHLSWWGAQRFWEFRIHAGALNGSGFTLPGTMYVGLGHNDNVAWAMTTGGPDTADIYELTLNPQNTLQYKYDDTWKDLKPRTIEIKVKAEATPRKVTIYDSHNGPIVLKQGNKAYAARLAYADEVQFGEAFYHFNFARNIDDFRKGLALNQLMPQNVMAADTSGNIFYHRTGRVPVRPEGYDFFKPVDGSTARTEWRGIHAYTDHYQVVNPPQGYMQNCNIPPDVMMIDSPMTPDKKRPYLFGETAGRTHQRGARAVQILSQDSSVTPDEAIQFALDVYCFGSDIWIRLLRDAHSQQGAAYAEDADYEEGLRDILTWNGYSTPDSTSALKFYYWRSAVIQLMGQRPAADLSNKVNDFMAALGKPKATREPVSAEEQRALLKGLSRAMATMRQNHSGLQARYGDVFRAGRDEKSWPVGGGSLNAEGMGTLRAIGFASARPDHTRWGHSGQTSTQVVILTKPIRSWTQPPIGQSDHPESPHYRDQAEKLFSPARMKSSWYSKAELLKHVCSRKELKP